VTAVVRFDPAGPLRGDYTPPADKSISHRAALFAGMCDEPVTIENYLASEDTHSTLNVVRALGAGVDEEPDGRLVIRGVGLHAPLEATGGLLNVGNAGTLMRLLPGWLAGQPGGVWTLDGDDSIRRRPVDRVAEPLRLMGAAVEAREHSHCAAVRTLCRHWSSRSVRRDPSLGPIRATAHATYATRALRRSGRSWKADE